MGLRALNDFLILKVEKRKQHEVGNIAVVVNEDLDSECLKGTVVSVGNGATDFVDVRVGDVVLVSKKSCVSLGREFLDMFSVHVDEVVAVVSNEKTLL